MTNPFTLHSSPFTLLPGSFTPVGASRISRNVNFAFVLVALLYFGSVALSRKVAPVLTWRWALFFYGLTLVFIFLPLMGPYSYLPLDDLYTLPPWNGIAEFAHRQNPETNDIILQFVPWARQVRISWLSLKAPLWNSAAGGGYPLLANGQSSALSPLRLVTMPLSLAHSFAAESALKLLIALSFSFIYARRHLSEGASAIVAVSFAFSTFVVVWLEFPHVAVAVFLPAVLLAVDLLCQGVTFRRVLFAVSIFTFLLIGGHPETAAHIVFFAGLYLLFRLWLDLRSGRQAVAALALSGVLAIFLASPFLLPFLEALPKSLRYETLKEGPPVGEAAGAWLFPPLFNPGFYGTVRGGDMWGTGMAEQLCGYGGILGLAGWVAGVMVLTRRRRWRSVTGFHLAVAPLVLAIIMKCPVIYDLFHALPLFSMAANGRMRLVFCWIMAYLAGALFQTASEGERAPAVVGIGVAAAVLGSMFALNRFPLNGALQSSLLTTLPRVVVLLTALLVLSRPRPWKSWVFVPLVGVIVLDLWTFGYGWNPAIPEKFFYPETPLLRFLEAKQRGTGGGTIPFRITGTGAALFPNSGAMYGLEDIRAHDPMAFGRFLGALRYFTGYTTSDYFAMLHNLDDPFIDYLNVRYLVTSVGESYHSDRFVEVYSGADGRVYENRDVLPRFYAARNVLVEFDAALRMGRITTNRDWANTVVLERIPSSLMARVRSDLLDPRPLSAPVAKMRIVKSVPRQFLLDIDAPRWTLVTSSQPDWPGWHIVRNGSEALKDIQVNAAFIGFIVPPGKSRVEVAYDPRSYYAGVVLALLTALGLAAWPLHRRLRRAPAR
jgi:hypothetical protein